MKYYLLLIGLWLAYCVINVFIAEWNDEIVVDRLKVGNTKQIDHPAWAFYYFAICAPMWFLFRDWLFLASVLALHLSIFPVAYNLFRANPPFNLSKTTTAWSDKIMISMGLKSTEIVNIAALLVSLTLLIISLFQKH